MRILYVHERFGNLAGAEANALITATELNRAGHTLGLLHGPSTGKGEEAWHAAFPFTQALGVDAASDARHAIASFRPDAVYVHKMPDLSVVQFLTDSGVPLVRMVHDHDIYCLRSYKYNYITREICTKPAGPHCVFPCLGCVVKNNDGGLPVKWQSYSDKLREIALNRRFDRMVVVTSYMRDELLRNGFDEDRIRIHAPVPRPGDASIRSSFSDRNLILYAGQIIRGKGVDVLLESLAHVTTPFECIILGDGNHRAYCEELSRKLGLADRVTFKGFVPQEELKSYYRECSVVAISSVWPEPIATIGLEVMRYALPVVAFDAGGIKDWLEDGHNGFLVPWMDRVAYAARLDQLLQNKPLARAMGEAGLALVSERYDFAAYIQDLEALFAEVSQKSVVPFPSAPTALRAAA
ncbi:MAG: glycosyltransferase family 4 protein [Roseimicrobium sp.]